MLCAGINGYIYQCGDIEDLYKNLNMLKIRQMIALEKMQEVCLKKILYVKNSKKIQEVFLR